MSLIRDQCILGIWQRNTSETLILFWSRVQMAGDPRMIRSDTQHLSSVRKIVFFSLRICMKKLLFLKQKVQRAAKLITFGLSKALKYPHPPKKSMIFCLWVLSGYFVLNIDKFGVNVFVPCNIWLKSEFI